MDTPEPITPAPTTPTRRSGSASFWLHLPHAFFHVFTLDTEPRHRPGVLAGVDILSGPGEVAEWLKAAPC